MHCLAGINFRSDQSFHDNVSSTNVVVRLRFDSRVVDTFNQLFNLLLYIYIYMETVVGALLRR